jgi:hypothetical protein
MNRTILVLVALATVSACSAEESTPPRAAAATPARESTALLEIRDSLARIEERLDVLEMTAPAPQPRSDPILVPATLSTGDDPASNELVRLTSEVRALRVALEEHLVADSEGAGGLQGLTKLKEKYPEANWPALNQLIHAWNLDEETTRQDMLLMGYREVMEKYGAPTTTWGGKGGLHWLYFDSKDPVTGETRTEIWIFFADGIVTDMGIKQP